MGEGPFIQLTHLNKSYTMGNVEHRVLHEISLTIQRGSMLAIEGASGSGKTTLMNILGLLDNTQPGEYILNSQDVAGLTSNQAARLRNQTIGFLFQQFHLLPHFSALYNVALPLLYRKEPLKCALASAQAMLNEVGMGRFGEHRPTQLSGGQQQRIALARALIGMPQCILADEPTGALDSKTSQDMMRLFHQLHATGRTLILVTHDPNIAAECPQRVRLADGRITSREGL